MTLGWACLGFWSVHAADSLLIRGEPSNLLWTCNLGCLAVGLGLLTRRPWLNSVGTLWLSLGVPMWILDLFRGGEFIPTSIATHAGGLLAGLAGSLRLGMPRGAWVRAIGALVALQAMCRLATPEAENVNLSHAVWKGWEWLFPYYPVYWAGLLALSGVLFLGVERALRAAGGGRAGENSAGGASGPGPAAGSPTRADRSSGGGALLVETLQALDMPPEARARWFAHLRRKLGRHGGRRVYGGLLDLLDRCEQPAARAPGPRGRAAPQAGAGSVEPVGARRPAGDGFGPAGR